MFLGLLVSSQLEYRRTSIYQPLVGPLDETVELVFRGKERLQNCYRLEDTEETPCLNRILVQKNGVSGNTGEIKIQFVISLVLYLCKYLSLDTNPMMM